MKRSVLPEHRFTALMAALRDPDIIPPSGISIEWLDEVAEAAQQNVVVSTLQRVIDEWLAEIGFAPIDLDLVAAYKAASSDKERGALAQRLADAVLEWMQKSRKAAPPTLVLTEHDTIATARQSER